MDTKNENEMTSANYSCPLWCNGYHEISEDLSVSHRSNMVSVPAIVRHPDSNPARDRVIAVDLAIGLERKSGENWLWLSPEDDIHRGLVVSAETGRRLSRSLIKIFESIQA